MKRLARRLGVPHRTVRWRGEKPATGLQEAARDGALPAAGGAARKAAKARHILTAHTLDDQAETVLIRMTRGSGLTGLAAMARDRRRCRSAASGEIMLVRPLLEMPKARLRRDARARQDRFCRRSVEPRSALHPGAAARRDAGAGARRARRPPPGAAGAPRCGAPRPRSRRRSTAAAARAAARESVARSRCRSCSMPRDSAGCPPRWRCACSAVRSRRPATRGRSSSASSRRCIDALAALSAAAERHRRRLRRTLAGALVTLAARPAHGRARAAAARRRIGALA